MAPRSAVTLRDIAERVGVSVSAVSMALADHPRIGAETKSRVLRAAEELGYVTNAAGRALRVNRVGAVALIVPKKYVASASLIVDARDEQTMSPGRMSARERSTKHCDTIGQRPPRHSSALTDT